MENKKGFASIGVIAGVIALVALASAGAGYVAYKNSSFSTNVGTDGVEVKTDGVNVKTGNGGVDVNAGGTSVTTNGGGANVTTNGGTNVRTEGGATSNSNAPIVDTVLIFDASGSMNAQADGGSRINIAKTAVSNYVSKLDSNVNLSVLAYGHKGDSTQAGKAVSCAGIDEVYWMSPVNKAIVEEKVNQLNPNGWTPITAAMAKADSILQKSSPNNKKRIVLLSDGEETCGGDPIAYAKKLKSEGVIVDVIGLDVVGIAAKQLSGISINGGGSYFSVASLNDLNVAVDNLGVRVSTGDTRVDVTGDGARVQSGNVDVQTNGSGANVKSGGIEVDTTKGGMPSVKGVPGVKIPSY